MEQARRGLKTGGLMRILPKSVACAVLSVGLLASVPSISFAQVSDVSSASVVVSSPTKTEMVRERTLGRGGIAQSRLYSAAFLAHGAVQEDVQREEVRFPSGLSLTAGEAVKIPRQLTQGSVIAVNVELAPGSEGAVKAEMEGQEVSSWQGTITDDMRQRNGDISLTSDSDVSVQSVEIIYDAFSVANVPDQSGDLARLSPTQQSVVSTTFAKAAERSAAVRAELVSKVEGWGYTEAELDILLDFLSHDADLVIHIRPKMTLGVKTSAHSDPDATFSIAVERDKELIDAFLADTHYRNQFEVGVTNGSASATFSGSRRSWEIKIFENGYEAEIEDQAALNAHAWERPKYGALNPSMDPRGPATQYGDCYMIIRAGARDRITLTEGDSSGASAEMVGTPEDLQHVVNRMNKQKFERAMLAALGYDSPSGGYGGYTELQFHGPAEFDKDFERLICTDDYQGSTQEARILKWAGNNQMALGWISDNKEVNVQSSIPPNEPE